MTISLNSLSVILFKSFLIRSAWVAQSVKHLTLAQVMISQLVGSSPMSGPVLTAQSLEPASDSVSSSLSFSPLAHVLSLSVSQKRNIKESKRRLIRQRLDMRLIWGFYSVGHEKPGKALRQVNEVIWPRLQKSSHSLDVRT